MLQTFATMTTDANQQLAAIQDRMPVIIEKDDWPLWMGEVEGDVLSLLCSAPEHVLHVWPVGKRVGNVKNNGPALLEPEPEVEPELDLPLPRPDDAGLARR
jgi:putative SOS response-associated peptidase YedK